MSVHTTLLVVKALQVLVEQLAGTPYFKRTADSILDMAEAAARDSATPVDDTLVLPICAALRAKFQIPEYGD